MALLPTRKRPLSTLAPSGSASQPRSPESDLVKYVIHLTEEFVDHFNPSKTCQAQEDTMMEIAKRIENFLQKFSTSEQILRDAVEHITNPKLQMWCNRYITAYLKDKSPKSAVLDTSKAIALPHRPPPPPPPVPESVKIPPAVALAPPPDIPPSKLRTNPLALGHIGHWGNSCWAATALNAMVEMPQLEDFLAVSDQEKELVADYGEKLNALSDKKTLDDTDRNLLTEFKPKSRCLPQELARQFRCLVSSKSISPPSPRLVYKFTNYIRLKSIIDTILSRLEKGTLIRGNDIDFSEFMNILMKMGFYARGEPGSAHQILISILKEFCPVNKFCSMKEERVLSTGKYVDPSWSDGICVSANYITGSLIQTLFQCLYSETSLAVQVQRVVGADKGLPPIVTILGGGGIGASSRPNTQALLEEIQKVPYFDGAVMRCEYGHSEEVLPLRPYRLSKILVNIDRGPPNPCQHWLIYFYYEATKQWYCSDDVNPPVREASFEEIQENADHALVQYEKVPEAEITEEMRTACRSTGTEWDGYRTAFIGGLPPEISATLKDSL